jgi:hypothetical protein
MAESKGNTFNNGNGNQTEPSASVEQIFGEAENALRKSMETLGQWGDQARDVLQNRPGVVLASISIAGFMTGVLLRQGGFKKARAAKTGWAADPIIVFLTGAVAGITLGQRVLRDLGGSGDQDSDSDLYRH